MLTTLSIGLILIATTIQAQWTLQTSNTNADLRGIYNVGDGVAWASGTNGTVLRSEDGGYVWQSCTIPSGADKLDFRGIQAFDANRAIVMSSGPGDQSRLYTTTDGCHSWSLLFKNPDADGFFDALFFQSSHVGWLLGDPVKGAFTLFVTSDGGRTWTRQENHGLHALPDQQGAFAASNSSLFAVHGLVVFGSGGKAGAKIYRQTGASVCVDQCSAADLDLHGQKDKWDVQIVPVGVPSESSGVFSVSREPQPVGDGLGGSSIVAVGGDYTKPDDSAGTAAFSTNGGDHWLPAQSPPHGYRSAVAYDSYAKTWITVGPNGTDISTDNGRTWRPIHPNAALREAPDADRNWNALSLPFVVGPHGRIGRFDQESLER